MQDTNPEDLPKQRTRKTAVDKAVEAVLKLTIADLPEFCATLQVADERLAEWIAQDLSTP